MSTTFDALLKIQSFLTQIASDSYPEAPSALHSNITSKAIEHLFTHYTIPNRALVLDVGCGAGLFAAALKQRQQAEVWGAELNVAVAGQAKGNVDRLLTGDIMVLVDEAHATGVFGHGGTGVIRKACAESQINCSMGTLSKALGGYGGFVACSLEMRHWLIHKSRSFVYSTALPPAMVGAAQGALQCLQENPEMGRQLLDRAALFRARLNAAGLDTGLSESQIIPVMVGENERAVRLQQGILAVAIRPPTVPRGTARLRLSVCWDHPSEVLDRVAGMIAESARREGVIS